MLECRVDSERDSVQQFPTHRHSDKMHYLIRVLVQIANTKSKSKSKMGDGIPNGHSFGDFLFFFFFLLLIEVLCLIFSSKFQGMVVDEDL